MYAMGQGVPQDDVRAYMWWSIALAQELCYQAHIAIFNQKEVALRMTPAQIKKAKRMTREYAQARKARVAEVRS
jgi:TPR repeat protein